MLRKHLLLLFILLLTSCARAAAPTTTPAATRTATPTIKPTESSNSMARASTSTPNTAPSDTSAYFKTQCLEALPTLPTDFALHENLVLRRSIDEPDVISDLRDQRVIRTLSGYASPNSISPNGKWLALDFYKDESDVSPSFLIIESVDGKKTIKIPWDNHWDIYSDFAWLDNEHIVLNIFLGEYKQTGTPGVTYEEMASTVVINPFTNEKQYLHLSNFPDWEWIDQKPEKFVFERSNVIYNPTLTRALYLREIDYKSSVVLWDMQAGKAITSLDDFKHRSNPAWIPGEKKFIVIMHQPENIFSLDQDGHLEPLTHFEKIYSTTIRIGDLNLSPDGEAIAFWLDQDDPDTASHIRSDLLVLQLKTHTLTKYCFSSKLSFGDSGGAIKWSHNSRFLMLGTYLIDLQQNWITQLMKSDYSPIGFVAEP